MCCQIFVSIWLVSGVFDERISANLTLPQAAGHLTITLKPAVAQPGVDLSYAYFARGSPHSGPAAMGI